MLKQQRVFYRIIYVVKLLLCSVQIFYFAFHLFYHSQISNYNWSFYYVREGWDLRNLNHYFGTTTSNSFKRANYSVSESSIYFPWSGLIRQIWNQINVITIIYLKGEFKGTLTSPIHKTTLYERSFLYKIANLWNSIPDSYKSCTSSGFRSRLRSALM